MKKTIIALVLLSAANASAWISTESKSKEYHFKFKFEGQAYEVKKDSGSYEEAFEAAAQDCFRHFKNGERLSEDKGLRIIDSCANPRS